VARRALRDNGAAMQRSRWRETIVAWKGSEYRRQPVGLLGGSIGVPIMTMRRRPYWRAATFRLSGVMAMMRNPVADARHLLRTAGVLDRRLLVLLAWLASTPGAMAKDTGYVFVSHEKTNNIAVIDPKQNYQIITWISTSHRPRDMKFRADRKLLYVACGDDDVIDVVDVARLKVADHIPTGRSPEMFELSRDGTELYVSNEEGSAVQEISIADKIIMREFATGAEPEGIAVSADGKVLYVTSEVTDMVHVVDTEAGNVTDNVVVGTRPRRLLPLPNGRELWVSNELSGQVSVIDRTTNQVSASIDFLPPGFRQVDVTPVGMTMTKDGKSVIVALGRANHVAFVDSATRKVQAYVLVGSRAWGVALSADERTLYVANGMSDDVSVVDVASHKAIRAIPVGRVPHSIVVDD
jgi:PQQ-dependent catabolism-associated beta-propeller protein